MTTQNGLQAEGVLNILKNEVIDVNLEQFEHRQRFIETTPEPIRD